MMLKSNTVLFKTGFQEIPVMEMVGSFNFVTKRGLCENNAKISWTQVETGSAVTWKYPSCVLEGKKFCW